MAGSAARLEVLTGKAAGMSLVIDNELVIGRLAEGAGRLADDEEISRSHARLSMDSSGQCMIEDLGSTNGTWVNGMRITTPQTLSEGDTVELGGTTMVVREVPAMAEQPPPEQPAAPPQRTVTQAVPMAAHEAPAPEAAAAEAVAEGVAAEGVAAEAVAAEAVAAEAAAAAPQAEVVAPGAEAEVPEEPLPESLAPEPAAPEAAPLAAATEPLAEGEAPVPAPVAGAPQTLSLHLDIDFATGELQLRPGDSAEPVRLVFDGDSWRSAPSPSTEKGNPA
jgi:pSer/pThr/pTyr-binding forkhead associated (FHA) protein